MSDNNSSAANNPYSAPQSSVSEEVGHGVELATRWERLFAAIIDGLVMACVTLIPTILFFGGWSGYLGVAAGATIFFKIGSAIFGFAAFLVVNGYFLARDGQTIGKKAMSIKIVRTDDSKADFIRIVVWRQLPPILCQLIPFVGGLLVLVDLLCIFRDSRRCIHDDIADTKVVKA